jgi:hypothetical protein
VLQDHALRLAGGVFDRFEGEAAAYEVDASVSLHAVDHVIAAELKSSRPHMREVIWRFRLIKAEKIPASGRPHIFRQQALDFPRRTVPLDHLIRVAQRKKPEIVRRGQRPDMVDPIGIGVLSEIEDLLFDTHVAGADSAPAQVADLPDVDPRVVDVGDDPLGEGLPKAGTAQGTTDQLLGSRRPGRRDAGASGGMFGAEIRSFVVVMRIHSTAKRIVNNNH